LLIDGDIPVGMRRRFITADGKPVNLGTHGERPTGSVPGLFLHAEIDNEPASFVVNRGTLGSVVVDAGTVTAANTSPSDDSFGMVLVTVVDGESYTLPSSAVSAGMLIAVKLTGGSGTSATVAVVSGEYVEGTLNGTVTLTGPRESASFQTTGDGKWWRT
jgi:hypothetical protein